MIIAVLRLMPLRKPGLRVRFARCELQIILVVQEFPAYNAWTGRLCTGCDRFQGNSLKFISNDTRNECYIEGTGQGTPSDRRGRLPVKRGFHRTILMQENKS